MCPPAITCLTWHDSPGGGWNACSVHKCRLTDDAFDDDAFDDDDETADACVFAFGVKVAV